MTLKTLLTLCCTLFAMALVPSSAQAEDGPYRHVVLFKFKDSSSKEDVQKVVKAFGALGANKDLKITDFEWGTNTSPEGLNDGFTHCFFVTFANKADLEAYLPHKAHKAFVEVLKPHLDKVLVVDYIAKEKAE